MNIPYAYDYDKYESYKDAPAPEYSGIAFTRVTDEMCGAKNAGYTLDFDHKTESNLGMIRWLIWNMNNSTESNANRIGRMVDSLYDNDGDLYQGSDGNYYAVYFAPAYMVDTKIPYDIPLFWHRLKKS